jgi:hypothetical protein
MRGRLPRRRAGRAISRVKILRSTLLVWRRRQAEGNAVYRGRRVVGNAKRCKGCLDLEPNPKHENSHLIDVLRRNNSRLIKNFTCRCVTHSDCAAYGYFHRHLIEIPLMYPTMSQEYMPPATCFRRADTPRTSVSQYLAASSFQARYSRGFCRHCIMHAAASCCKHPAWRYDATCRHTQPCSACSGIDPSCHSGCLAFKELDLRLRLAKTRQGGLSIHH